MKKYLILLVLILIMFFITACEGEESHQNTTGLSGYKDSDVALNCTYKQESENAVVKSNMDVLYNYDGYQIKIYEKIVITYPEGNVSDEHYQNFVTGLNPTECEENRCTDSHLELGTTSYGMDTVIDRYEDRIEFSYHSEIGEGRTIGKEEKEQHQLAIENNGYTCR